MAEMTTKITFVRLGRDRIRLFAAPVLLLLLTAAAAAGALITRGPLGIALAAVGVLVGLAGLYLLALVWSYRLLVEPGGLRLRWLGGEHRYRLVRGQVTRVAVTGHGAAILRPRFGALGWAVGPATLRGDEPIELIRLSRRPALIVVPTDRGRLAIAAAVESDLLAALTHAVRLQERVDEVASRRAMPAAVAPPTGAPAPPPAPRVLTGIERTLIEQRLAAERAAGMAPTAGPPASAPAAVAEAAPEPAAAKDGVALAAEVAPVPAAVVTGPARPAPSVSRRRERARRQRPGWLAVPGPSTVMGAMPIALPLIGAGIAWLTVTLTGRPALPVVEARLLLAALALVGPVGALGGLIARTWYPRLGGLVTASAIASLAMLTRTILA